MRLKQLNKVRDPIGREPRPKQAIPIEAEKIIARATRAPPKPHEELRLGRSKGKVHDLSRRDVGRPNNVCRPSQWVGRASAAASARRARAGTDLDSVRLMISPRWLSTVRWLMPRSAAMFLLGWPAKTICMISSCREVSNPTRLKAS